MAKRFQPMKEFGRSMKKPKLDISINRGSSAAGHPSTSKGHAYGGKVSSTKCDTNNFWDDDDDDVILFATQVAEAAVAAEKHTSTGNNLEFVMTETDITFTDFGLMASTSTQNPVSRELPAPDILSKIFEDDDFDLLAVTEKEDPGNFKKPLAPIQSSQNANIRKQITKPQDSGAEQNVSKIKKSDDELGLSFTKNTIAETTLISTQSAARKQLASERQIKFLMDKVDALKKENSKLSNELEDTKSKIESKEGESSLLRDELRHMKQQAQNLKMEKLMTAEAAKNECQTKIGELSKILKAQEAEIRLKEAQTSRMRMRHADDAQKLHQSMCMTSITQSDPKQNICTKSVRAAKHQMRLNCLDISHISKLIPTKAHINPLIFETSQERGSTKKQRTLFQIELENMQTYLAQLQSSEVQILPQSFGANILESVCKVLTEFWTYIHSLEYLQNCRIYPYHGYSLNSRKVEQRPRILQQPSEIYNEERCISLRRYFAALSVICLRTPLIAKDLMHYKHGEYHLLQILTDSVNKLGFAREICEHFGVLEASAFWIYSLLQHVSQDTSSDDLGRLTELMKHIVFTRPSAWIFQEISLCLRECCRLPQMLDMLCINSPETTFVADRVRSVHRFSNETCFLQVYCSLLEIAFPLSSRLSPDQFKLLTVICRNHVCFTYHCFTKPPKFIHDMLPNDDDDDEDNEAAVSRDLTIQVKNGIKSSTSVTNFITDDRSNASTKSDNSTTPNESKSNEGANSSNPRCECYVKLCLSVVTLLFQLMRQWMYSMDQYTLQVSEISRLAVQLLHLIFYDNYLRCLFQESEATTKHYLRLITKWWQENSNTLKFDDLNLKFLERLLDSHVIPKDISAAANYNNITADLAKWQIATKDDVSGVSVCAKDATQIAAELKLIEDASNNEIFFESLKGYAFNFQ